MEQGRKSENKIISGLHKIFGSDKVCAKDIGLQFFSPVFLILSFAWDEAFFHIFTFKNANMLFALLFAIPFGVLAGALCDVFSEKASRICRFVISSAVALVFCIHTVYYHIFQDFVSVSFAGVGGDAIANFFKALMLAIFESLPKIIVLLAPVIALPFLLKFIKPDNRRHIVKTGLCVAAAVLTYIATVLLLPLQGTGAHTPYDNYHGNFELSLGMEKLGVITSTGFDIINTAEGQTEKKPFEDVPVIIDDPEDPSKKDDPDLPDDPDDPDIPDDPDTPDDREIEKTQNTIDGLDFKALAKDENDETLKKIFEYLASLEPTKKNEYTGMFEGYNLVMICAESFSPIGVNENYTPTLYKLVNSGFIFDNFWATYPSNTTNGEYSFLTGLFPDFDKPKKNGSFLYTAENNILMNMNIARWFAGAGAKNYAYHDHVGTYYGRNRTHTHLGYEFKGSREIGGLYGWPESDLVMMQKTVCEYINDDRFHAYYMTVSGHHNYRFGGYNAIADKNRELVEDYPFSDSLKAYMACSIELDRALEYLIDSLTEAGKLENTVIVLCPDHYPYGLTDAEYKEFLGHKLGYDGLERNKSNLIIWNSKMEPVHVTKPCCTVDVLPTLLNLFGFEFDSRLYSGTDILSPDFGIAVTTNQSFITDKIVYNSRYEKVYYLDKNWEMPDNYLDNCIRIAKNRFIIASNILNHDFYAKLPCDVIARAQGQTEDTGGSENGQE